MSAEEKSGEGWPFGPVQMLVLEFDRTKFNGEILPELDKLREAGLIRLVDLAFVTKSADGEIDAIQTSDLSTEEVQELGAMIGALIGLGMGDEEAIEAGAELGASGAEDGHLLDEGDVWYLADAIPEGSSAAVLLIEHRWLIPLRDKIVDNGGIALADEWIHPRDLIAIGAAAALQGSASG